MLQNQHSNATALDPYELRAAAYQSAARDVGKMVHAGMSIVAGTDTGDPFAVPGDELHRELELLVEAGLSPAAALRAATLEPARMLQLQNDFGTVDNR